MYCKTLIFLYTSNTGLEQFMDWKGALWLFISIIGLTSMLIRTVIKKLWTGLADSQGQRSRSPNTLRH